MTELSLLFLTGANKRVSERPWVEDAVKCGGKEVGRGEGGGGVLMNENGGSCSGCLSGNDGGLCLESLSDETTPATPLPFMYIIFLPVSTVLSLPARFAKLNEPVLQLSPAFSTTIPNGCFNLFAYILYFFVFSSLTTLLRTSNATGTPLPPRLGGDQGSAHTDHTQHPGGGKREGVYGIPARYG